MNPSPRAIEQAIEALKASPGTFQRLVEEYARIACPAWFPRLLPRGRRADDVTRKGWPDAISELPDGTVAILEATHSESWDRHLSHDVQKTEELGSGAVSAFLFAAWAKSPNSAELDPYRQRLLAIGIPRDRILWLFRDHLVSELSRPLFARLWVDPLRLPASCLPFDVLDRVPRLFGPEERADLFAPRRSEYQAGLVYRPRLADTVEVRLAKSGWALIRGRGAAGKTTLALCIALGPTYVGHPIYYLDVAELERSDADQAAAIETVATRGDQGVLFIVDNIHLAPVAASRIFAGWQELAGNGSHLLLLGRLVTPEPDVRGRADPLEDLDREVLQLAIDGATLIGVYRRILSRFADSREAMVPPPSVADGWLKIFGGDLIAFSTAVAQRNRDLLSGDLELATEDAQRYIEREYLQSLSQAERDGVARLAAAATLELSIGAEALGTSFTDKILEQGWIIRSEHGSRRYSRYRLVHPGLGDLVLTALRREDRLPILSEIAAKDSHVGVVIAWSFRIQGQHSQARTILLVIAESPHWFSIAFGAIHLPGTTRLFETYGILSAEEIDLRLSQEEIREHVVKDALRIPVGLLGARLSFAEVKLPGVYRSLVRVLESKENWGVLIQNTMRTDLGGVGSFLGLAQGRLPGLYASLVKALNAPENHTALIESALRAPLHLLPSFLIFAQGTLLGAYMAICRALAAPENQVALVRNFLRTPLDGFGSLLMFAQGKLPGSYDSLIRALNVSENHAALIEGALRAPLGQLSSFLAFAQEKLPNLYGSLIQALKAPENHAAIVESALRTPLEHFGPFFDFAQGNLPEVYDSVTEALAAEENQNSFVEMALRAPLDHLGSFLVLSKDHLKSVYTRLTESLVQEDNVINLVRTALVGTPDKLSAFLGFTREYLDGLHMALCQGFAEVSKQRLLADLVTRSSIANLSAFLKLDELAPAIVEAIDAMTWQEWHLSHPVKGVEALPSVARQLAKLDRPELATAPARGAMLAADVSEWHRSGVNLMTLSHTLRLAGDIEPDLLDTFLNRIATPDWLKSRYLFLESGPLAGALFTLWYLLDSKRFKRFRTPSLLAVVEQKVNPWTVGGEATSFADLVSLVGVGALIGLKRAESGLAWANGSSLHGAIAERIPSDPGATLGPLQVQLWLGLRRLAAQRKNPLRVDKEHGRRILQLWREAAPEHPKLKQLNAWMLAWIERCAAGGWRLLRDDTPLLERF